MTDDPCETTRGAVRSWCCEVMPDPRFVDVSVSEYQSCAVRTDGKLQCWGGPNNKHRPDPGTPHGFGTLWLSDPRNRHGHDLGTPPEGKYSRVSLSEHGGCAIRSGGQIVCWSNHGLLEVPGEFVEVQASRRWAGCGIRTDGELACWDEDAWHSHDPSDTHSALPEGPFTRFVGTSSYWLPCALSIDGAIACWDDDGTEHACVPEGLGPFTDAVLASGQACGIRLDGTTVCWHSDTLEPLEPAELLGTHWHLGKRASEKEHRHGAAPA